MRTIHFQARNAVAGGCEEGGGPAHQERVWLWKVVGTGLACVTLLSLDIHIV